MTTRPTAHPGARHIARLAIAALGFAAACGTELPTSAELQGMDVAAAEKRAFAAAPNMAAARYVVDGKDVSEREAKAIAANRIATIEIRKRDQTRSEVHITTQALATSGGDVKTVRIVEGGPLQGPSAEAVPFDGLLIVDGVKTDPAKMNSIDPKTILNVEVIKGTAAEKVYGPEGAKGVIRITTKK